MLPINITLFSPLAMVRYLTLGFVKHVVYLVLNQRGEYSPGPPDTQGRAAAHPERRIILGIGVVNLIDSSGGYEGRYGQIC